MSDEQQNESESNQSPENKQPPKNIFIYPFLVLGGILGAFTTVINGFTALITAIGYTAAIIFIGIGIIGWFAKQRGMSWQDSAQYSAIWTLFMLVVVLGYREIINRPVMVSGVLVNNNVDRQPVDGYPIQLYTYRDGDTADTTTNPQGIFEFEEVVRGEYDLIINGTIVRSEDVPTDLWSRLAGQYRIESGRFYLDNLGGTVASNPTPTVAPSDTPMIPTVTSTAPQAPNETRTEVPVYTTTSKLTGNILLAGSSTVNPMAEFVRNQFIEEGFQGNITINAVGTGMGVEIFCEGDSEVGMASRSIQEEVEVCLNTNSQSQLIELRIGTDSLLIITSSENEFLRNISVEQLAEVFSTAEYWSDISSEWPSERINRIVPSLDSGTVSFFLEIVYGNFEDRTPLENAQNITFIDEWDELLEAIAKNPYSIGFLGYWDIALTNEYITMVSIDSVTPTLDSVEFGQYPLSRPLYLYTTSDIVSENPQVLAFLDFYLTNIHEAAEYAGYAPPREETLEDAMQVIDNAN